MNPKVWIFSSLLMIGMALAGSDGDWFPWINFVGVVLFFVAVVGIEKAVK